MTNHTPTSPVLVIGATGKTGRRIVDRLNQQGVAVRPVSRAASIPFDWQQESTWGPVLDGCRAAYIAFSPDIAMPGAPETVAAFARAAIDRSVRRLVLLSGRGEEEAQRAEQLLIDAGADCTVLRCSWFMQNFSESVFLDPILASDPALPVGNTPEPFVDVEDIADVAVAALMDERHIGQTYELTGSEMLTFDEAFSMIGRAAGKPLRLRQVTPGEFATEQMAIGVPAEIVGFLQYLFGEVLDGRNACVMPGVEQALGRKPRRFSDFVHRTAATGVWRS